MNPNNPAPVDWFAPFEPSVMSFETRLQWQRESHAAMCDLAEFVSNRPVPVPRSAPAPWERKPRQIKLVLTGRLPF